jgi:hypothetical protein
VLIDVAQHHRRAVPDMLPQWGMQSRKELARGAVPAVPQIARELRQPSKLNGQARIDF